MSEHELKTLPTYFQAVWDGRKTFEARYDDRGFQAGDAVRLREYDPESIPHGGLAFMQQGAGYTGREITATIGYILHSVPPRHSFPGPSSSLNLGDWVVFSLVGVGSVEVPKPDPKPKRGRP